MRRLLHLALCTSLSMSSAFPQTKRAFTFEDMMALKRVGEPVPSPDGRWVLFSVVDVSLEANTRIPHVWIAPLGATGSAAGSVSPGAGERVLIPDQDSDRPRWAPDGKRFAFISNKQGGAQVWLADFDPTSGKVTATHQLTALAAGAGGELWSPDGNNILFVSDVYPECQGSAAEEQDCNARKVEEREKSKVKALTFQHLLYRHWNAYKEGKRSHIFIIPADRAPGVPARDLTPGDYDAPVFSVDGQDNYAFSPDGRELCYTSNHDKVEAISTNNDLWIVPVLPQADASQLLARTKNITAANPASDSTPLYSPDGKYIAYRAQQRPGYESDRFRLMLHERQTGAKKNLTETFENWVGTFTWAPDSSWIFFAAAESGQSPIWRVSPGGGSPQRVLMGFFDDPTFARDKTLLLSGMSVRYPNEIYRATGYPFEGCVASHAPAANCQDPVQLSHLNDQVLSQISMSPLESFWFEGAKRDKVQGFLIKPPNFEPKQKYPVKFLIHGGPQGAWGDDWSYRWNPELFAANGYVVVMINFHGSTGYGQKFVDAINGDWGGAPFEDLMKGLDHAEKTYPFIDQDRECALGASYGGYMANWVLGHSDRFKCIVTHDGMFNTTSAWGTTEELWFNEWEFKGTPYTNRALYDKWSPQLAATSFKTPTLVIHGQLDYRLDVSEGLQLFTTLQRLGVPSKMLYFPDEGHWVLKPQNSQLWYKTVNDWVEQWTNR